MEKPAKCFMVGLGTWFAFFFVTIAISESDTGAEGTVLPKVPVALGIVGTASILTGIWSWIRAWLCQFDLPAYDPEKDFP